MCDKNPIVHSILSYFVTSNCKSMKSMLSFTQFLDVFRVFGESKSENRSNLSAV